MKLSFARGAPKLRGCESGFTLIEISIVLVIIGLIVGGILAGRDLIKASEVRATITQIEKYNQATNAFYEKCGYLPGDIPAGPAAMFGLATRGQYPGEGDGNGLIEGRDANTSGGHNSGGYVVTGETAAFWADLSTLHLIEGSFAGSPLAPGGSVQAYTIASTPPLSAILPSAALGNGNVFYVWSGGATMASGSNGVNYFGLSAVTSASNNQPPTSTTGLTVQQAYSIDIKIDDGLPQSGRVMAEYWNFPLRNSVPTWAAGSGIGANSGNPLYGPSTSATPGSSSTCYDNGNVGGASQQYSLEISNGGNVNCALSFRMQAGD